jgi:zinc protease
LGDDLPILLDTLADVIQNPEFPKEAIERVRAQLLTALDLRAQDTGEMASMGFDQIAYANHPYRFPSDGYIETIKAIKRTDIQDFHKSRYGPAEMVIVIVGPIEADKALSLVGEKLGDWVNPDQKESRNVPDAQPMEKTVLKHTIVEEKSQADIILGAVGPRRKWEDFYPALLGNSILGQFGMMGRIGESVRVTSGLAYYAYSSLSSSIGPGPWTVAAGVDPANLDKTISLIKEEVKRFTSQPVNQSELEDVQSNYLGKLPLSLESNTGVAGALLNIERHGLGLDYFQKYEDMILDITPEKILDAAKKYLDPDKLAISTAGPEL